jgi:hypothetical protein
MAGHPQNKKGNTDRKGKKAKMDYKSKPNQKKGKG